MRTEAQLHAALERLTDRKVPGLSAVVVEGERVVAEDAVGLADIGERRAATPETVYLWFSMTKIVTATAVMQLAEDGRLGLEDPVARHLPEFPRPHPGWPEVQVRHLLNHSSGLPNPFPVRWVHPADAPAREPHAFMRELLGRHGKLRFPAGAKASYSNLGYVALGEVVTAAAGRPYAAQVRERILDPLGMSRTDFAYRPDIHPDVATGYQPRLSPMTPLFRLLLPDGITGEIQGRFLSFRPFCVDGQAYGGLIGSPRDAARFMSAHLAGGSVGGVRILSPASVAQMQTITAHGRKLDVGLGWFRRRSERSGDERHLEHLGGGGGFFNMMRIHPGRGLGVVVMGNATAYDHRAVAAAALGGG